jgi:5-methylcytosine-specific restriction endonuclease McrA
MSNPRRNKIAYNQGWTCGICIEMLGPAFEIDHKIRWIDSFDDSEENLRALCVSCHKQKTAMENQI